MSAGSAERPTAHVAILRWPEDAASAEHLRALGRPRLLLVAPDAVAPNSTDCDEDWIRLPVGDEDLRARATAVAARAARHNPRPAVSGDGRIMFRGQWVGLSQIEEAIARALSERFGEVVDNDVLAAEWGDRPTPGAIRVHITRLRKRLRPLGLVVRTVRGRGYVLETE
jgi:DNA-binding response OmpR family regulator